MRKILLGLFIFGFGFTACNKATQPLTRQEIKQQVDSITNIRIKELDEQSQRDLEHRIKIEVKVKVDSIVNALQLQQAKGDSILHAKSQKKTKDTIQKQKALVK